jgi:N-acetylglucosaminyl-diphospho-decaprenol L-rhamnosyltransferase
MSHSLTAIVVTHNSAATLQRCLASLERAGVGTIRVVDNASTDGTREVVGQMGKAGKIDLVPLPQNRGFAAACNVGADKAHTDFLFFLNPDAELLNGALAQGLVSFANAPVGAVGLGLVDAAGRPEVGRAGYEVTLQGLVQRKRHPQLTRASIVGWVSAGALLVRRQAWEAVGGFDEQFFLYWEDVDLCKRLWQAGWQVVSEPAARVTHHRGSSSTTLVRTAHYDASADKYFRKHYASSIWLMQRYLRRAYRLFSPAAL